jgi:hypothetical protein
MAGVSDLLICQVSGGRAVNRCSGLSHEFLAEAALQAHPRLATFLRAARSGETKVWRPARSKSTGSKTGAWTIDRRPSMRCESVVAEQDAVRLSGHCAANAGRSRRRASGSEYCGAAKPVVASIEVSVGSSRNRSTQTPAISNCSGVALSSGGLGCECAASPVVWRLAASSARAEFRGLFLN